MYHQQKKGSDSSMTAKNSNGDVFDISKKSPEWQNAYVLALKDGCSESLAVTVADFTVEKALLARNVDNWQLKRAQWRARYNFNPIINYWPERK